MSKKNSVLPASRFGETDIYLFKAGRHYRLYEHFGSRLMTLDGKEGCYFAVWAPNAESVSLIGNFNGWNKESHVLLPRWDESGIWEGFIPGLKKGDIYKYAIRSAVDGRWHEKGDPFAMHWEEPPKTASVIWDTDYNWQDGPWMQSRSEKNSLRSPISVYEMHIGSWKKKENGQWLTYRELAPELIAYLQKTGFTHVQFMPVMEHPFYGSWGYQLTGYFAPSSRFGTPEDFMYLIEQLHLHGFAVYLDWVPSHFPGDAHGLYRFDGSALYEHADPRKGFHPDWKSYIFNYGRNEVRAFLISNALYWLDKYHVDGLRVDAVASMLYLDYSRKEGEWIPNQHGGNENLEAIAFLKEFNEQVYARFPDVQTIAEESTSWPAVSRPTFEGGLGFGMKWMMGWMNDTLQFFKEDPLYRNFHYGKITFSLLYAFSENFMLPLSHDEVVYGKGSLLTKMPGDPWQKKANLRLLLGYMTCHPGTQLLFMGGEFGQIREWNHDESLQWELLEDPAHRQVLDWLAAVNRLYRNEHALYDLQFSPVGFEWIINNDHNNCVIVFVRKGREAADKLIIACNFTPVVRYDYRFGVPAPGSYREILNSDELRFGGSGVCNDKPAPAEKLPLHGRSHSISVTLPPLACIVLKKND